MPDIKRRALLLFWNRLSKIINQREGKFLTINIASTLFYWEKVLSGCRTNGHWINNFSFSLVIPLNSPGFRNLLPLRLKPCVLCGSIFPSLCSYYLCGLCGSILPSLCGYYLFGLCGSKFRALCDYYLCGLRGSINRKFSTFAIIRPDGLIKRFPVRFSHPSWRKKAYSCRSIFNGCPYGRFQFLRGQSMIFRIRFISFSFRIGTYE